MTAMAFSSRPSRSSLWSRSGQFWLGAFMVAEAPLSLIVMVLPDAARIDLLAFVFRDALTMVLAAGVLIAPGILVGLIAHRLGWGE